MGVSTSDVLGGHWVQLKILRVYEEEVPLKS